MDNFAPSSEDFLSSGFQQLYSELNEDEIFLWDSDLLINNNSDMCNNNNNNNNFFNPEPIYYNEEDQFLLSNNFCDNSVNLNEPNTFNYGYEQQDWDLNLESLVLENSIECTEYSLALPEKTLFCNDSCNLFLKESSENLNLKLNQQKDNLLDEKHFPCTFGSCRKIYAKAAHLKAHLRRHLGDKPYVCTWPECTWKFSRSDELARHKRSHSGVKPFKCIYCTKCFARSDHLAKHRKVHERKIASGKVNGKGLWGSLQPVRSGRRPKCEL